MTPLAAHWISEHAAYTREIETPTRTRNLAETERLATSLLEDCGITRTADVTGLDRVGIDVFHTVRPLAMPGLNTVTSGKGVTRKAARVSAIMEAIERFWCEPRLAASEDFHRSSYADLLANGEPALDPRRLIPRASSDWTPSSVITWYPARELSTDTVVLIPALAVFTPFTHENGLFSSNTIGLAIGNSPKEALLHGLLEIVEHDSTAFGETLRLGASLRMDRLPSAIGALVEKFTRAGVELDLFAYVTELGITTVHATTKDRVHEDGMLFNGGVGCHLDPQIAATRAITEVAQSRLNVLAGAREDFDQQAYRRHASYNEVLTRYERWRLGRETAVFDTLPSLATGNIDGDLTLIIERLGRSGIGPIFCVELAPEGYPFSVTKVVVPGMEVFHEDRERRGTRINAAMQQASGELTAL